MIDMKRGDIVEMVEFESVTDPVTKQTTVKKFKRVRRCVSIEVGVVNPLTKMMEYKDISMKEGIDLAKLADPAIIHGRYMIKYDNISEVEIP